jgi:nickel transport protein
VVVIATASALIALRPPAAAHQVEHELESGDATVIALRYADGTPFAFESYEIHAAGESTPIQVGRSNAQGRIAFVAPQAGRFRLRAFSEDGHGVDFLFDAHATATVHADAPAVLPRGTKILVGLALLFGLFGILSLVYRSRR